MPWSISTSHWVCTVKLESIESEAKKVEPSQTGEKRKSDEGLKALWNDPELAPRTLPCVMPVSRFEGTNEVYIQSSAFNALQEPPAQTPSFEGTNEVYIQSSAFDALQEGENGGECASAAEPGRMSVQGIRLAPPMLQSKALDGNLIGIVGNSGILPTVDIDKSFDMPVIEDAGELTSSHLEMPLDIGDETEEETEDGGSAVYASRMNAGMLGTRLPDKPAASVGILPQPLRFGLPPREAMSGPLHPEDMTSLSVRRAQAEEFAIDGMVDPMTTRIGAMDSDTADTSFDDIYSALFAALIDAHEATSPRCLWLRSASNEAIRHVIRGFLHRCGDRLDNFSCYTAVMPNDGKPMDMTTALVCSRLGCYPDELGDKKAERLVSHANTLFEQRDLRWGLDILLVRFGLSHLVLKHRGGEAVQLESRNAVDMLELLSVIVSRDAQQGPVVLVLPVEEGRTMRAWRDVLRALYALHVHDVLILLAGSDADVNAVVSSIETIDIPPLTLAETRAILSKVLTGTRISAPTVALMAEKAGGRYENIRLLYAILRHRGWLKPAADGEENPCIAPFVKQLGRSDESLQHAFVESLSQDQVEFLCHAALFGGTFALSDIVPLISLCALDGEDPWLRPKRAEWCARMARELTESGDLVEKTSENANETRYLIPNEEFWYDMAARRDLEHAQTFHGCCAHRLSHVDTALPCTVAYHYFEAGMIPEAVNAWMRCARVFAARFENASALELCDRCLSLSGPKFSQGYAEALELRIELSCRLGMYEAAEQLGRTLLSFLKFLGDDARSCQAMIVHAHVCQMNNHGEDAQSFILLAVKIAEAAHDDDLIGKAYFGLAKWVFESGAKGAFVNGLRYAEKSLETRRRLGNLHDIAESQALCARIYMMRGEPARARTAASEAYHALSVSGFWYEAPCALTVIAESNAALNTGLPMDDIERGFEIVQKTGNVEDRFQLIATRCFLLIGTLQRQAVRDDLDELFHMFETTPCESWRTWYLLLSAMFDFSRKNYKKTTQSLKLFFDSAQRNGNLYLLSCGYAMSAQVNLDVYKRQLGTVSIEKTEKLYLGATALFESIGAWHRVAESLRRYAEFLDYFHRPEDAMTARARAQKVDPYEQ